MKKFDNFCNALKNLKDIYKYEEPYDNVTLTGQFVCSSKRYIPIA